MCTTAYWKLEMTTSGLKAGRSCFDVRAAARRVIVVLIHACAAAATLIPRPLRIGQALVWSRGDSRAEWYWLREERQCHTDCTNSQSRMPLLIYLKQVKQQHASSNFQMPEVNWKSAQTWPRWSSS